MKISLIHAATMLLAVLSLGACSSMQNSEGSGDDAGVSKSTFEKAYQAAEDAYNKTREAGNLWTTTDDELKDAKEAAARGDLETAIKMANRARFESESAYAQYVAEKDAKPWEF